MAAAGCQPGGPSAESGNTLVTWADTQPATRLSSISTHHRRVSPCGRGGHWQSPAVVGVAVALAVAGAYLFLRPKAAPVAEVVGMQGGPVVAWQLPTTDEDLWAAGGCAEAGVLVRDTLRSNWVGCLDLEDGHVVWETDKLPQDPPVC